MNELRNINFKSVTGMRLISNSNSSVTDKKEVKEVKENTKKSDRKIFRDAFKIYAKSKVMEIVKGKGTLNTKDKYDYLKLYVSSHILSDISINYFSISKKIRKTYKSSGQKISKFESDTVLYNLSKNYIDSITNKHSKNTDSLFDIYATYNYTIDGINYDYLNDFHINIKNNIDKLREKFAIKSDLRTPNYLKDKIGKGRKKVFKLAFRLITMSEEITCDEPRKSYLEVCYTKEDFIYVYKLLGGGIRRYMKYYDIAPMFKIFVKAADKTNIINKLGYTNYKLNKDACLGIYALLFTQMILGTYGTRKAIRSMLEAQSESLDNFKSLISDDFSYAYNNKY